MPRRPHFGDLAIAILLSSSLARAGTHTWTGAVGTLWSDPGNWSGGSPAGDPAADLVFPAAGVSSFLSTDDIAGVIPASSIALWGGYAIGAVPGASISLSGNLRWYGDQTVTSTFGAPLTLSGGASHCVCGQSLPPGTLTLSGVVSGAAPDSLAVDMYSLPLVLTAANTFTGPVTVYGPLEVDGALPGDILLTNGKPKGGTLSGTGSAGGSITCGGSLWNAATIAPGTTTATGTLSIGGDVAPSGAFFPTRLAIRLGGTSAGLHDRLAVGGASTLTNMTLLVSLFGGFVPAVGDAFPVLTGSTAITGTFIGMPEGSVFTSSGVTYAITYAGGAGRDVVLTVTAVAPVELLLFRAE